MSHLIEINNSILDFQLETVEEIPANAIPILRFYQAFKKWNDRGLLSEITIQRDGQNLHLYEIVVEDKEGNVMNQTWEFASDQDVNPLITITMEDAWAAQVLRFGNRTQDQLFTLRPQVGLISLIVEFH